MEIKPTTLNPISILLVGYRNTGKTTYKNYLTKSGYERYKPETIGERYRPTLSDGPKILRCVCERALTSDLFLGIHPRALRDLP